MSKAILVMDMPDCCFHCDFCHEKHYDRRYQIEGEKFCGIEDMEVDEYYDSFYSEEPMRPNWCPLRELPEKKREKYGLCRQNSSGGWDTYGEKVDSVAIGYNQCIDDICKLG